MYQTIRENPLVHKKLMSQCHIFTLFYSPRILFLNIIIWPCFPFHPHFKNWPVGTVQYIVDTIFFHNSRSVGFCIFF